jgi:two-component system, response regulator
VNNLILLVEDNISDEKLTLLAFQKCRVPATVVVVRDGAEALAYLFGLGELGTQNLPRLPAVVLLDLKLPRIDGLEVLRRIRAHERTQLLPVVVLSASDEDEDMIRSYARGANAYVRKSVDFGEFVETASAIGVFWLRVNEPPPPQRRIR